MDLLSSSQTYDQLNREQVIKNLRSNLPEPLRELRSFLLFKYAPPNSPGGKRNKVPYYVSTRQPRHGTQGESADVAAMSTFMDALRAYRSQQDYAGLGIAALPHNNLTFIDLDNCLDEDVGPNDMARELLAWNTYAERSPGGHGLRLIVNGDLALDRKNHAKGIEVFSHKGFVTVTGQCVQPQPQPIRTLNVAQLARLRALLVQEETQATSTPTSSPDAAQRSIPSPLAPQLTRVKLALKAIDADLDYDQWIAIGQALHSGDPNPQGSGFKLWVNWSRRGRKFDNTSIEDMLSKWRGFKPGGGVTLASLFHIAKTYGYVHPKAKSSGSSSLPALELAALEQQAQEDLQLLCPGLFDHMGAYMFVGRAKIGKSRILGLMTATALTGTTMFGYRFSKKCKVLALTLEEDAFVLKDRLRLYMVDPEDYAGTLHLIDRKAFAENAKRAREDFTYTQWLDAVIKQLEPDFVFIDPLVNMRMVWRNSTEKQSDRITEQDYQLAAEIQDIAERNQCVIVFCMHGSKRKHGFSTGDFDPFEMVGTTSWTAAACAGSMVILDKPGFKPLEDEDDGQRIFSIRSRYQTTGDVHLVLQYGKHSTISSLGPYAHVRLTARQQEILEELAHFAEELGPDHWVTSRQLATECNCSPKNIKMTLKRFMDSGQLFEGRRLMSSRAHGYRLQTP